MAPAFRPRQHLHFLGLPQGNVNDVVSSLNNPSLFDPPYQLTESEVASPGFNAHPGGAAGAADTGANPLNRQWQHSQTGSASGTRLGPNGSGCCGGWQGASTNYVDATASLIGVPPEMTSNVWPAVLGVSRTASSTAATSSRGMLLRARFSCAIVTRPVPESLVR